MRRGSRPARKPVRAEAGFTLLEASLVVLLLGLVAAGLLPLVTTAGQVYGDAWRRQHMVRNGRTALDQMSRELRAAVQLYEVSNARLRFDTDAGDAGVREVEYVLQNGYLLYGRPPEPPEPLAGPFRSLQARCFDRTGSVVDCAAELASVRQVELELTAVDPEPDPVRGGLPDLTLLARVVVRSP